MNKNDLWEKFMKTGSINDYLQYTAAVKKGKNDNEAAMELQPDITEEQKKGAEYEY